MVVRKPPAPKKAAGGKTKARRGSTSPPVITSDVVKAARSDLPPARASSSRTMRFANAMAEVRAGVRGGKIAKDAWVPIATFASKRGAREVVNTMDDGRRPVDGTRSDWNIEARRDGDGSVLWVQLKARK